PDFDCYFGDGLEDHYESGFRIDLDAGVLAADDFILTDESLTAQQIRINVLAQSPDVLGKFAIYENHQYNNGEGPAPNPVATTGLIEPSQSIAIGSGPADTPFEDEIFYELTYDLPESIFLEPGHYWLIPQLDGEDVFWDATQTGIT